MKNRYPNIFMILYKKLAFFLILIIYVTSRIVFYVPALFGDDWSHVIGQFVHQQLNWGDWSNRRPFLDAPLLIFYSIFGLNVDAFYVVMYLLQAVVAVQLFVILRKLMSEHSTLALFITTMFLFYPADYSRTWLTMIGVWVVWVMVLIYAWCLLEYAEHGRIFVLFVGLVFLLLSLGIYEAQLGIALLWALLLFGLKKDSSRRHNLALLSPFLIGVVYSVWRVYGMGQIGVADNYIEQVQFAPSVLLSRLFTGFKVLIWAWIELFRQTFGGGPGFSFTYFDNWRYYLVIAGVIALGWVGVMLLGRKRFPEAVLSRNDKPHEIRLAAGLFVIGGLFVIAGYLPIVTVYSPNLHERFSRVNLFALPGASLSIIALLYMLALLIRRHRSQVKALLIAGMIPFLIIGIVTQIWVQYDTRAAWEEQKVIWAELFELVPDLANDTQVLFILPGYQECEGFANWKRTPFTGQNVALTLLYGNDTLSKGVFFPDLESVLELRQEGVVSLQSGKITPYVEVVVMIYDGEPRRLRLAENLQDDLGLMWPTPDYNPRARILSSTKSLIELRRLVGVVTP